MLMLYKDFKEGEFFKFFKLSEKQSIADKERIEIKLKPEKFQDKIDIYVYVLPSDYIKSASILLDRGWVGNEEKLDPNAKEFARSFLDAVMAEKHQDLNLGLWRLKGKNDKVSPIQKDPKPYRGTPPDVEDALNVYLGKKKRFEELMGLYKIVFENIEIDGKEVLRISVSSTIKNQNV